MLSVGDTGLGMTDEVRGHAFEPFFTTKAVGEGSGLGLSQVYGFAQQSNGHVEIESAPASGATITIYLPRATPADRTL
jgi:signal transduction histidine kinase